ncbi:hypothetical protein [uncultured Alsobacter sp.]|uniref:hypothetical protein n=1 Tax=uncultured Alsobacter sp. TaxID=1748258 RepID=UPI0025EFFEAC|nr:hypothetical protein [uncultured Alsobacter sp.]
MADTLVEVNLYGACLVRTTGDAPVEITGAKHKALFALLATAPHGRRTRAFVQETLWGAGDYDTGNQNLRRAVSDLRKSLGPHFDALITATTTELILDLSRVALLGEPGSGTFLEGIEVKTPGFLRWLSEMRAARVPAAARGGSEPAPTPRRSPAPADMLPAIAVLPFRSVPGDKDQATLGDWLAEEACRALSRSHLLSVISHLSSRELARSQPAMETVRERLQVDYCMTGSIRPDGGSLLLAIDLVAADTGRLLLTREYGLDEGRCFEDGLAAIRNAVEAVGREVTEAAITEVAGRPLSDIEDHRLVVAGVGLMHRPALRDFARGRAFLEEAVARVPGAASIHGWLGKWYVLSVFNYWSSDPAADTQRSLDWTARGLDIEPTNSFCLTIDGFAQNNLLKRMDVAADRYALALRHNPSEALSWLLNGALLAFQDKAGEAVTMAERGRRLSPIDPFGYFFDALGASVHMSAGHYEAAATLAQRSLAANGRHLSSMRTLIAAQHYLGRRDEARKTAALLMQRQPNFTIDGYRRAHPAADFEVGRRVITALAASGIR